MNFKNNESERMDGWGKCWTLIKMINDQNNEMKEWTLKFWNDWLDGWKNKRKEVRKKWMNEWMNEWTKRMRFWKKLKLKWWIPSVISKGTNLFCSHWNLIYKMKPTNDTSWIWPTNIVYQCMHILK
jgi:hypothetical protein